MKIIEPSVEILTHIDGEEVLKHIESCYRVCYKSEDLTKPGSAEKLIKNMALVRGHESPLEHWNFSVRFTCDRGVSHEIVRHRLASYSQESTRYANYSKGKFGSEITVIKPCFLNEEENPLLYYDWWNACKEAEDGYMAMLAHGAKPEEARSVLPNSLKTELIMTANLREWRHFFKLRCDKAAHPQMRQVALMLLEQVHNLIPVIFDDLWEEFKEDCEND